MKINSQKSIIEKLNLQKFSSRAVLHIPENLHDFEDLAFDSTIKEEQYDLVFLFIYNLEEFREYLKKAVNQKLIKDNGYLYFAYPKKNNPEYDQYIERDSIYNEDHYNAEGFVHGSNLKFSRMVSLNETFTVVGMKAQPEKKKAAVKSSQCVDDYIESIDDVRNSLKGSQEVLAIYDGLTFGYQKDWARYIFSAKRKETQEKRLIQMKEVLSAGYKSMDLFRRDQKNK
ncbi:YdeI/OmpD-associated family protein [Rossellomorea vietnamensis]|uniref:YdeI/OmpD-associated family protein n=1 Tax=Rossellomorea vietnamensis TaxID=218284 RepID=A0A5D4MAJ6_9BACI|nr:YdeI/OmpD-associated family protein [Rossellomorea vietnamensis]TYR98722.1 YdeI/OmpD-associated family protein [Rossellomorea vietnamensis]